MLFAMFSKFEFWVESMTLLGHVLSKDKIMVDPTNIEAIHDWARTTSPIEVCSFIGLADYYR